MPKRALVEFSRTLSPSSLASMGIVSVLAITGVAVLFDQLLVAGSRTGTMLLIAGVLLVPVILTLISRASEAPLGGTLYATIRREGRPLPLFLTGWLSIGGFMTVAALMARAISSRVSDMLSQILDLQLSPWMIVIPITVLAGLLEVLVPFERSRARNLVGWVAVALLVMLLGYLTYAMPPSGQSLDDQLLETRHRLVGLGLPAAGLWFVEFLLDYRRVFRRSDRVIAGVTMLCWVLCVVLCVWASWLLMRNPELIVSLGEGGTMTRGSALRRVVMILLTLAICGITLTKCLARMVRLAGSMALDGMLPGVFERHAHERGSPGPVVLVPALVVMALGSFVEPMVLSGLAAITFLWVAALVIGFGLRSTEGRKAARFPLPLHPLLPIAALVVALALSLTLPKPCPTLGVLWLVAGLLGYKLLARRTEVVAEGPADGVDPEEPGGDEAGIPETSPYRVLVCLGPATNAEALVRAGAHLARARQGDLVVLQVVSLLEQIPRLQASRQAERQWSRLEDLVGRGVPEDVSAYPVVRIAPTSQAGILSAAARHGVHLILMDLPEGRGLTTDHTLMVRRVLNDASQPVAVLRGALGQAALRVHVATTRSADAPIALAVGDALARDVGGSLSALRVHPAKQDAEEAAAVLEEALTAAEIQGAEPELVESEDPLQGLLKAVGEDELLIVGCTRDLSVNRTRLAGMFGDVIASRRGPTMLVYQPGSSRVKLATKLWDFAYLGLPTLSTPERAEVYADMRHSATASVDFFVLIVIAALIATFGLAQDSAAVIIGAMLVAPLMSPILAIAHGIVQGNLTMVRRSATSTFKGTVVAMGVAAGFTFVYPDVPPTAQILARVEPSLLDLGVGLAAGAAAAYGVSRKSVAGALPGVAISVALVPPLCVVGYGLAADHLHIAVGASILFLTNLSAIVMAAMLIFFLLGFFPRDRERTTQVKSALALNLVALGLLCIPLALSSARTTYVNSLEATVEELFRSEALERDFYLRDVQVERTDAVFLVTAEVWSSVEVTDELVNGLRDEVQAAIAGPVQLELLFVKALRKTALPRGAAPVSTD